MTKPKVLREIECIRCGYKWYPKKPGEPLCCANQKCKSRYWNRPRRVRKSGEQVAREIREATGRRQAAEKEE